MAVPGMLATGAAAAASKTLFEYNRDNFMEDRDQRMRKEFAERKYRTVQAHLWRADVRDFVSLTERKMSIYLLVNVLLLGFTVNLWCEGRLPLATTPMWLTMGMQIALVGAFSFLLLTVWLAMHAAVAAQSYQTRVLTQLVRLPIPAWQELEACRTYGSDFERLEARQLFRVPFLMGRQEQIVAGSTPAAMLDEDSDDEEGEGPAEPAAPAAPVSTDPWGLERRGSDIYELGCQYGEDVAKLRHIKLTRQAAVYWQTYDAFARVSMSVGVNQLLLAMCYYILGYVALQIQTSIAAFAGMSILVCLACVLAKLELTLNPCEQIIYSLMVTVPVLSNLWGMEYSAPFAFIIHGIVVGLLAFLLRVRTQENGAMLPLAFQGVLFLDVFGWAWHKDAAVDEAEIRTEVAALSGGLRHRSGQVGRAASAEMSPGPAGEEEALGFYAADYARMTSAADLDAQRPAASPLPMPAAVVQDEAGQPFPTRPEDLRPSDAVDDMRQEPGAPRMWDTVNAVEPPGKEFWDPVTFMPMEGRGRHFMDEVFADFEEEEDAGKRPSLRRQTSGGMRRQVSGGLAQPQMETGHENEVPGILPWVVFRNAAGITSLSWIIAGLYCFLTSGAYHLQLPDAVESPGLPEVPGVANASSHVHLWQGAAHTQLSRSRLALPSTGWGMEAAGGGVRVGPIPEEVATTLPHSSIALKGFACDPDGRSMFMSDGLSTFAASVGQRVDGGIMVAFRQAPPCRDLLGESVQDAAVVCASGDSDCEALVLHRHGQRVAACALQHGAGPRKLTLDSKGAGFKAKISQSWLRHSSSKAARLEKAAWLVLDPSCAQLARDAAGAVRRGCASIGSTRSRLVRVQNRAGPTAELHPADVILEGAGDADAPNRDMMRAFNERYVGVLQPNERSIKLLDVAEGGLHAGTLTLPVSAPVGAFCVGGGHVYLLGEGKYPKMWRFPVPEGLRSDDL